ncbi:TPA: LysR family transcriptional regulator [Yersinia enterocolitica]
MLIAKYLKYFIVTAQKKSITAAADALCITPSPLSRSIKELESKLGCKLFKRTPRGFTLSQEGALLYEKVMPHYKALTDLEKEFILLNKRKSMPGEKLVAFSIGTDIYNYFKFLSILKSDYLINRNISLNVNVIDRIDILLNNKEFDVFFSQAQHPPLDGIIKKDMPDEPLYLAISNKIFDINMDIKDYLNIYPVVKYTQDEILNIESFFDFYKITPRVIVLPHIMDHIYIIGSGSAIGIVPLSIIPVINKSNSDILTVPFVFNRKILNIKYSAYYLNENKDIIENNILPLLELLDSTLHLSSP